MTGTFCGCSSWSRTGVINPPVQLGVNKRKLKYMAEKTSCVKLKTVWQPRKKTQEVLS